MPLINVYICLTLPHQDDSTAGGRTGHVPGTMMIFVDFHRARKTNSVLRWLAA